MLGVHKTDDPGRAPAAYAVAPETAGGTVPGSGPGCQKPGGQLVRKGVMRVTRKPYKTPDSRQARRKPLIMHDLSDFLRGVLSGSKARKRAYLETI